jgi:hypothetical protein
LTVNDDIERLKTITCVLGPRPKQPTPAISKNATAAPDKAHLTQEC